MRVTNVTASRSRAVPVEQYGGKTEAFASVTIELEEGDDAGETMALAQAMANISVATQFKVVKNGVLPETSQMLVDAALSMQLKITNGEDVMPIARSKAWASAKTPVLGDARKGLVKGAKRPGLNAPQFRVELKDKELQEKFDAMYNQEVGGKIVGPSSIPCMLLSDDIDRVLEGWFEMHNAARERTHRCDGDYIVEPREQRGQVCELRKLPKWKKKGDKHRCEAVIKLYVWPYELGEFGQLRVRSTSEEDYSTLYSQLLGIEGFAGRLTNVPLLVRRVQRSIKNSATGQRNDHWQIEIVIDMDKYDPDTPSDTPEPNPDAPPNVDPDTGEITEPDAAQWWGDEPPAVFKRPRPWSVADARDALRFKAYSRDERGVVTDDAVQQVNDLMSALDAKLKSGSQHALFLQVFGCASIGELTDGQREAFLTWLTSKNTTQEEVNDLVAEWWLSEHPTKCSVTADSDRTSRDVALTFAVAGRSPQFADDAPEDDEEIPF